MSLKMIEDPYRVLLKKLLKRLIMKLGNNLVSVVVYGSVARKTTRKNSDIDLLIIADSLPKSRMKRQELFLEIEKPLESMISDLWDKGFYTDFSPIILSVEEALKIRPIYLDMVEDAIIIYDKNGFFNKILNRLRKRLKELGAKRIWVGDKWYWMLKPDIKFGEIVEIE